MDIKELESLCEKNNTTVRINKDYNSALRNHYELVAENAVLTLKYAREGKERVVGDDYYNVIDFIKAYNSYKNKDKVYQQVKNLNDTIDITSLKGYKEMLFIYFCENNSIEGIE